jgi:hypothetical protein
MGRPRKYASDAEKQAAYRARRGSEAVAGPAADNSELVAWLEVQVEEMQHALSHSAGSQAAGAMWKQMAFKKVLKHIRG